MNRRTETSRAFSLVELTVVLLLLSIVAAAATVNLSGRVRAKKFESFVRKVCRYDFNVRNYCKNSGKAALLNYDLYDGNVYPTIDGLLENDLPNSLSIDKNFEVEELIGGKTSGGTVSSVAINAYGNTNSYALKLTDDRKTQWILFAGLTGQASLYDDEETVRMILAAESGVVDGTRPATIE